MEFDLLTNALHSLAESLRYYNEEADENINVDKFKFCILLTNHCVELLLKELLVRKHPAFIYVNVDEYRGSDYEDMKTIGYVQALSRVKKIYELDFKHYEERLIELGKVRNKIQHYKCPIDGVYYKTLVAKVFSAIEYIINDVLKVDIKSFSNVIAYDEFMELHEDSVALKQREQDIKDEFDKKQATRYSIQYDKNKFFYPPCPVCGMKVLSVDEKIRCKVCNNTFENYRDLCDNDWNCLVSDYMARELGRRKDKYTIYQCFECDKDAVFYFEKENEWVCLSCGERYGENTTCDECGNDMPYDDRLSHLAMSDFNIEDYKYLCSVCAIRAKEDERYLGYEID